MLAMQNHANLLAHRETWSKLSKFRFRGGSHASSSNLNRSLRAYTALTAADNRFLGTWKVNTAKSQFKPGPAPTSITVTFAPDGDLIKRSVEGVNADGTSISTASSIKWDGQDHAINTPDGAPVTVAVRKINDRTVEYVVKNNGKVTVTGRASVSRDGKTMTSTEKGVNPKGEQVDNVIVSERQ